MCFLQPAKLVCAHAFVQPDQVLLQWMQALGGQEMQWAQVLDQRTLITDVHSARELYAPWMADHRGKSKSDLTSWRW